MTREGEPPVSQFKEQICSFQNVGSHCQTIHVIGILGNQLFSSFAAFLSLLSPPKDKIISDFRSEKHTTKLITKIFCSSDKSYRWSNLKRSFSTTILILAHDRVTFSYAACWSSVSIYSNEDFLSFDKLSAEIVHDPLTKQLY